MNRAAQRRRSLPFVLIGLGWLGAATALGAGGMVDALPPAAGPVVIVALTALVLGASWWWPGLQAWLAQLDVRWLVSVHLTRFVGGYFLYLYARGQLPYAFAVPGGWGDITVAAAAVLLLLLGPPHDQRRRAVYLGWNILGLVDIVLVVATAGRLLASDPASMAALLRLPLSLLPTFLVPLIIASHVIIAQRLAAPGPASDIRS